MVTCQVLQFSHLRMGPPLLKIYTKKHCMYWRIFHYFYIFCFSSHITESSTTMEDFSDQECPLGLLPSSFFILLLTLWDNHRLSALTAATVCTCSGAFETLWPLSNVACLEFCFPIDTQSCQSCKWNHFSLNLFFPNKCSETVLLCMRGEKCAFSGCYFPCP